MSKFLGNDDLKEQWLTLIDRYGARYIGDKINSGWGFRELREHLQAEQTRTSDLAKPIA